MANISPKQANALASLLEGNSITAAAEAAGVHRVTLQGWLKEKDFAAEYRTARRMVVEQAVAMMQINSQAIAHTMLSAALGKKKVSQTQLRAAIECLATAREGAQLDELWQRMEDLEKTMEALENGA